MTLRFGNEPNRGSPKNSANNPWGRAESVFDLRVRPHKNQKDSPQDPERTHT